MKPSIFIGLLALLSHAHGHANANAHAHAHAELDMMEDAAGGKKGHKEKEPKIKLKKLPHCSLECLTNAMADAGCGATNYACGCANYSGLKKKAAGCVLKKCGIHTARRKVLPAIKALCMNQELIEKKLEEEYARTKHLGEMQTLAEATLLAEATPLPEADVDGQ